MAIKKVGVGVGTLGFAVGVNHKPAYTGANGGSFVGFWIQLPAAGMTTNNQFNMLGYDGGGDGVFTSSTDAVFTIGGDAGGQVPQRMRPGYRASLGTGNTFGTSSALEFFTTLTGQMARETPYLIVFGTTNTGTTGSPVWQNWMSVTPSGGTPEHFLMTSPPSAGWLALAHQWFRELFIIGGSSSTRTPDGVILEHFASVYGNFPWDAGNNRPSYTELTALAAGTKYWGSYIGGTLPAPQLYDWRKLASTADLADSSGNAHTALTIAGAGASPGVADNAAIAPSGWSGVSNGLTIDERPCFGGLGLVPQRWTGTYSGSTPSSLQYRLRQGGTTIVDWTTATVQTIGSGKWTLDTNASAPLTTLANPTGYTLDVRNAADTAQAISTVTPWFVGLQAQHTGQSQVQIMDTGGRGILAPAAGLKAWVLRIGDMLAGSGAYAQPSAAYVPITAASATGGGVMAFVNGWWADQGIPVVIVAAGVGGTSEVQWTSNAAYGNWNLKGDGTSLPLPGSANGSGIATMLAIAAGRQIDAFIYDWGTSLASGQDDVGATWEITHQALVDMWDGLYTRSPASLWLYMPFPRSCTTSTAFAIKLRFRQMEWAKAGGRRRLLPQCNDIVMDNEGSAHQRADIADSVGAIREIAGEGNQRLGITQARGASAALRSPDLPAFGPLLLKATWVDPGTRLQIRIQTGRVLQTLNGAAIAAQFWTSTDRVTWINTGYTMALANGNRDIILTFGSARPATFYVDYLRDQPLKTGDGPTEAEAIALFEGLLYDASTWRNGRPMHMQSLSGNGHQVVAAAGLGPRVVSTIKRLPGTAAVPVRMVSGGTTVNKTINVPVT